jgi:hypothetical protein
MLFVGAGVGFEEARCLGACTRVGEVEVPRRCHRCQTRRPTAAAPVHVRPKLWPKLQCCSTTLAPPPLPRHCHGRRGRIRGLRSGGNGGIFHLSGAGPDQEGRSCGRARGSSATGFSTAGVLATGSGSKTRGAGSGGGVPSLALEFEARNQVRSRVPGRVQFTCSGPATRIVASRPRGARCTPLRNAWDLRI